MTDILKFHMIRHGPVFNPDQLWYGRDIGFDLTSAPVVQHFNHLAEILPSDPDHTLWLSSDYPRAQSLAEATLRAVHREKIPQIIINKAFIEQQYGVMEGMVGEVAKQDARLTQYFANMWENSPPEGESMQMLQGRIGGHLDELTQNCASSINDIVIFAHGGVNMAAFAHATGQRMIDVFKAKKSGVTPSFSYVSRLELHYDRGQQKWADVFEYDTGLPKQYLPK